MSCSEWKEGYLKDIADITMGQSPKGTTCNTIANGIPLLNGPTEFGQHHPYPVQFTIEPKKICNPGDLLFCVRGSTVGRMNWADINYAIGRGLASITPKIPGINHFIKGILEFKLDELLNISNGSTFPNITRSMLTDIKINIPPMNEMMKISKILETIDNKIALNNEMNKTLEEMAQSIFKRWFVDFEFPNEDGQPYKSSGGEMVESELGMIPKGWEVKKMKDISNLMMGISPKSSSYNNEFIGVPLLNGAGDFDNGNIRPTKYTTEAKRVCSKGDIILSIRGTIGNLNISDSEYCLGRSMCALRGKEDIDNMLIFMYMSRSIEQLKNNAIGSVIVGLSKPDIEEIMIAYPDYKIRKYMNDILSNLYYRKKHNIEESNNIKAIRESLLPKLMNGEISINNL